MFKRFINSYQNTFRSKLLRNRRNVVLGSSIGNNQHHVLHIRSISWCFEDHVSHMVKGLTGSCSCKEFLSAVTTFSMLKNLPRSKYKLGIESVFAFFYIVLSAQSILIFVVRIVNA